MRKHGDPSPLCREQIVRASSGQPSCAASPWTRRTSSVRPVGAARERSSEGSESLARTSNPNTVETKAGRPLQLYPPVERSVAGRENGMAGLLDPRVGDEVRGGARADHELCEHLP